MNSKIMMRLTFFLLALFQLSSLTAQVNSNAIVGIWESEAKDAKMEIYSSGETFNATLLWGAQIVNADGSSKKDSYNPDESMRDRELVGSVMIKGLRFEDDEWENGRVYNNANGKWYKCYVWMEEGQLHLRGYLGMPILGETTIWNRLQ